MVEAEEIIEVMKDYYINNKTIDDTILRICSVPTYASYFLHVLIPATFTELQFIGHVGIFELLSDELVELNRSYCRTRLVKLQEQGKIRMLSNYIWVRVND